MQATFSNDELDEKCKYLEQKYHALVKRMGASQEDIDFIEEEIMQIVRRRGQGQSQQRKSRVSGPAANKYKENSQKMQMQSYDEEEEEYDQQRRHMGGYNLTDSGPIVDEDVEQELDLQTIRGDERESQNQSRLEHRQGKQVSGNAARRVMPNNAMVDSYEIYGENQPDDSDVEAVEEEIAHYSNKRGGRGVSSGNQGPPAREGISDEILISGE